MTERQQAIDAAQSSKTPKRLEILFFEGYIGNAPTVVNIAEYFRRKGWNVEIHTNTPVDFVTVGSVAANWRILSHPHFRRTRWKRIAFGLLYRLGIAKTAALAEIADFFLYFRAASWKSRAETLTIGIDFRGLITSWLASIIVRREYIFLSLENDPVPDSGLLQPLVKMVAKRALQGAKCVIIQDQDRFETMSRFFDHRHEAVFLQPNSPYSGGMPAIAGSNHLREALQIDAAEYPHIVLQPGMISDAVCSKDLVKGFSRLAGGFALVYHAANPGMVCRTYLDQLRAEDHSRSLFLSLSPVGLSEIDRVFSSATIGAAFYRDISANFSQIAMASGKLGYFLKNGVPVLTSNQASFCRLISRYRVGVVVNDPTDSVELRYAIDRILSDYDDFRLRCRSCYTELLDFDRTFKGAYQFLDGLTNNRRGRE